MLRPFADIRIRFLANKLFGHDTRDLRAAPRPPPPSPVRLVRAGRNLQIWHVTEHLEGLPEGQMTGRRPLE